MDSEGPCAPRPAKFMKRPKYYAAQIGLIERYCLEGMGYKAILKEYPISWFTLEWLKSAVPRHNDRGALGRKAGSGRKRTRRTPEATEAAREFFE